MLQCREKSSYKNLIQTSQAKVQLHKLSFWCTVTKRRLSAFWNE